MDFTNVGKLKRQIALWEETQAWVEANPLAYARFEELALAKALRGERFSIGSLTEVVRWDASIRFGKHDFKIKNGLRRYIAIKLMQDHPEIEPYITTRRGTSLSPEIAAKIGRPDASQIPTDIFGDEDEKDDTEADPFDLPSIDPDDLRAPPPADDEVDFIDLF